MNYVVFVVRPGIDEDSSMPSSHVLALASRDDVSEVSGSVGEKRTERSLPGAPPGVTTKWRDHP